MAKIKVALAITELDLGGAERCLTEIARRVDPQRFSPIVYCLGPRPSRPEMSCLPALETAGIEVHCLDGRHVWQFPLIVSRLRKLLQKQRPDVFQSFLFHANVLGRIAARRAGVKTVLSGIRVAERRCQWHLRLDRWTEGWVDRYVCVSRSVADFTADAGGIPREKLAVIPNGIDVELYTSQPPADLSSLSIPPGRRLVTFIGRLEPQKGVQWLVETATAWLAELPHCDLLLVGEGSLQNQLETMCRAKGIAGRVHFAGWRSDIPQILAASSLLVLPSAWEGMPNVILEAMGSGLPVVATNVEGVSELLGPQTTSQTVPYGDTAALTSKILQFLHNASFVKSVGQENRRRAEEHFSISRMVKAYENLWESILK